MRLGHRAHNPEVKQAHICTNSNSKMNCFKWDVPLEQDFKKKKKKTLRKRNQCDLEITKGLFGMTQH